MLDFFIDYKTGFLLIHLLGVVIALCGAVMSDTIFFDSIGDSTITPDEMRYIKRGGDIVLLGLSIIILSGICIFLSDVDKYIHSAKFLSKMNIILILTANGLLFHLRHIPWLEKTVGTDLRVAPDYVGRRAELIVSGVASGASWVCALVLGTLSSVPYDYPTIMSAYLVFLGIALIGALVLRKRVI